VQRHLVGRPTSWAPGYKAAVSQYYRQVLQNTTAGLVSCYTYNNTADVNWQAACCLLFGDWVCTQIMLPAQWCLVA